MTEREKHLLASSERYMACGIRSPTITPDYQMIIDHARGSRIVDCSGNEYIDYQLGSGPMFLGHAHPAVVRAVQEQVERGSSFLMANEPAVRLCEEIVKAVPCAEKVTLHNSGSEATFYAMRLARAYRKRDKILKFEGGFHGMNDYALMSNQWTFEPTDFPYAVANSAGIPSHIGKDVLIAPFNDLDKTQAILRQHAEQIGGVIIEPLCRTIPPVPGFLEGLRDLTRELDIPLIFDEVVTGFRMAFGGAQEFYQVTPDLCAIGKTISGGHPLGLVCGRADIMDFAGPQTLMTGDHVRLTGTYSSNPISAAVALAIIEELKKPGVYEEVNRKGLKLKKSLSALLKAANIPADVIGEATAFQPWFSAERVIDHRSSLKADMLKSFQFIDLLLDRGIMKGFEKFFISTAHSDEDIDYTIKVFDEVIEVMANS
jgi:glutamate-1-semialdehyde 2,1-aminomutase